MLSNVFKWMIEIKVSDYIYIPRINREWGHYRLNKATTNDLQVGGVNSSITIITIYTTFDVLESIYHMTIESPLYKLL